MLLLLFISSNFSLITCIPTLLGDIALFIVGFLTGAFDEDDAPVSSCAVSASSTLGVLLSLGMLIVAPNACGWGCFPLTLLALGGLVVVDGSSWNSLFSCVGGFGFCLFALDCLTLKGFLFSAFGIAVVSIGSLTSGTTSTFIFDFSSFNFFWWFTFLTCWLVFVLVLSWTVSLPPLRRVWWRLSVLMLQSRVKVVAILCFWVHTIGRSFSGGS